LESIQRSETNTSLCCTARNRRGWAIQRGETNTSLCCTARKRRGWSQYKGARPIHHFAALREVSCQYCTLNSAKSYWWYCSFSACNKILLTVPQCENVLIASTDADAQMLTVQTSKQVLTWLSIAGYRIWKRGLLGAGMELNDHFMRPQKSLGEWCIVHCCSGPQAPSIMTLMYIGLIWFAGAAYVAGEEQTIIVTLMYID